MQLLELKRKAEEKAQLLAGSDPTNSRLVCYHTFRCATTTVFHYKLAFFNQAYVKINYSESGYADVYLKDIHGTQLFHKKISGNFW